MRRLISLVLLAALLCAACPPARAEEHAGFRLMAETETRQLLLNEKTMEARIVDKATGAYNDIFEQEGKQGNKSVKNLQKAALSVSYIANEKTGTTATMDSYSLGVKMDGAVVVELPMGFEVRYTIGDDALTIDNLPKMIPVEKYNELLLPYWGSKDEDKFRDQYRVVTGKNVWVRMKDDSLGAMIIKQVWSLLFEKGKYTQEDLLADNAAYEYEMTNINPKVNITTRFELDGDDLVVTVPAGDISATQDNDVCSFELLPYFMTGTQAQTGYMLVPDGSGSLINLNNQKTVATSYLAQVYGSDILKNANTYTPSKYNIALPVYGIKTDDTAVLAIIERGAEIAELYADVSGRSDEFNRISARFILRDIENVALISNASITMPRFSEDIFTGDIVVRYKFLSGERASYTGMAKTYRQYLLDNGGLAVRTPDEKAPFFMEVIGAVRKEKFFIGIPYVSTVQATTIAQAGDIYRAFRDVGVENIKLLFSGLFSGGVKHASLTHASLDGGMGGGNALVSLQKTLQENGDTLFPSVYMGRVYGNKDFARASQAARLRNGDTASVVTFAEPTLKRTRTDTNGMYLSVHYLESYAEQSLRALRRFSVQALNIHDLGGVLTPDYKRRANVSRINATPVYERVLQSLSDGVSLMLDLPNDYALKYADYATNLPSSDNGYKVQDEAVPFLQMVLEGCVTYSGESWNLEAGLGTRGKLLYALESKSAPRFTFTYASPAIFHNTQDMDYMGYFSTEYSQWLSQCAETYAIWSDFYARVKDASIAAHDILAHGLRRVAYDNGVTLYVNYTDAELAADGCTIPAQGYLLEGGQ